MTSYSCCRRRDSWPCRGLVEIGGGDGDAVALGDACDAGSAGVAARAEGPAWQAAGQRTRKPRVQAAGRRDESLHPSRLRSEGGHVKLGRFGQTSDPLGGASGLVAILGLLARPRARASPSRCAGPLHAVTFALPVSNDDAILLLMARHL